MNAKTIDPKILDAAPGFLAEALRSLYLKSQNSQNLEINILAQTMFQYALGARFMLGQRNED